MKTKNVSKWALIFMVLVAVASVAVIRAASATGNQNHTCQGGHNCNDDGGNAEADANAEAWADANANADASADSSSDSSASADASNGDQTVNFNGPSELKTTGRAYQSSGDATADCQKFGGISSGWVGGALGLGINFTDKECRQLKVYDRLVDRGLLKVANATLCQTKTLRKLYGRDGAGQCQAELETAYTASQGAGSTEIQDEIADLRRMVRELSETSRQAPPDSPGIGRPYSEYDGAQGETAVLERVTDCPPPPDCPDCSEQATRAFEQCVAK